MTNKVALAVIIFSTFFNVARADLFEERRQAAQRQAFEGAKIKQELSLFRANMVFVGHVRKYLAAHGGTSSNAFCYASVMECESTSCVGGLSGGQNVRLSDYNPRTVTSLTDCKFNLKNGDACEANLDGNEGQTFLVTCYDPYNRKHEYTTPEF